MRSAPINVADMVVETLQEIGVRRIYGVVGDSLNGITEAVWWRCHRRIISDHLIVAEADVGRRASAGRKLGLCVRDVGEQQRQYEARSTA